MAIRRVGPQENIVLDTKPAAPPAAASTSAPQGGLRKLAPNEEITLDPAPGAKSPGLFSDLGSSLDVGTRELGNSAVTAAMLYGQIDPEQAADFVSRNKQAADSVSAGISPETRQQMETIQKSEGFFDTAKNVITNPRGTLSLSVQNLPQMVPSIAAAAAGGRAGAAGGAAVGAAFPPAALVTTVLGAAGGAIAGGFAGQVPVEVGAWVDQALADRGIDISTREARIAAYRNKPVMDEIRGEAERKGITTAAVDSLWNLFAGSKLFKSAGQGLVRRVGAGAADIGVQMGGEMVSEGAGQVAAYKGDLDKINSTDIYLEGLLSGPQAIAETGAGLLVRDKAAEALQTGQTQQTLGGDGGATPPPAPPAPPPVTVAEEKKRKKGSPLVDMMHKAKADAEAAATPATQVEVPLNRDDLAAAINSDTPLPDQKVIDLPQVAIDPALQAQGFQVGSKATQTNADGEIFEGTVASAQLIDGQIEVTILDDQGNLRTLFSSDGPIDAALPAPPAAPPATPVAPPAAEIGIPVAPPALTVPQTEAERLGAMGLEELTHHLEFIKNQAKTSGGWNKRTTTAARQVREELDRRFPQWDIPARSDVAEAAADVAPAPTDAQKDAGNYKKGHVSIQGLPVTIETVKGSIRSGTDKNGNAWQVEMPAHYGYIKRSKGADDEHVDVYIGDNPSAKNVYVIDQIDPDAQEFDEHKAMIGFSSFDEAEAAYNAAFNDGRGPERKGMITTLPLAEFKMWLKRPGARRKPLSWEKPKQADVEPPAPPPAEPPAPPAPLPIAVVENVFPETKAEGVSEAQDKAEAGQSEKKTAEGQGTAENGADESLPPPAAEQPAVSTNGDDYFDAKKLEEAKNQNSKSREILTYMNPDQFLSMAADAKGGEAGKKKAVLNVLSSGQKFTSLPFLRFEHDGKGNARVVAHEGRHRAEALKDRKVGQIPVILISAESGGSKAIRWGEQEDPNSYDFLKVQWPTKLESENGGKFMDFPVEDMRPSTPEAPAQETKTEPPKQKAQPGDTINSSTFGEMTVLRSDDGGVFAKLKKPIRMMGNLIEEASLGHNDYTILDKKVDSEVNQPPAQDEPPKKAETEQNVPASAAESQRGAEGQKAPPAKKRLEDVGEKLEGGRKFKGQIDKVPASEQAKLIIDTTKPSVAFAYKAPENQTQGVARFHQELISQLYNFSDYLYKQHVLRKGRGGRWSSKEPSWQDQVKALVSDKNDGTTNIEIGSRYLHPSTAHAAKMDIINYAKEYIEFANRLNDIFENSRGVEELRVEFKNALEDPDFAAEIQRFSGSYRLHRDILEKSEYSRFGKITDETEEAKKAGPEKKLIRPRLDRIDRDMPDYRGGKDVSAEEFRETFGFRGVEFGNWVKASEGQAHVNHAFDALSDLAKRLGIRNKDISIGGKLGFAFGARGSGEHAAHYERDTNIINLTKTKGDGSVAHEWAHALDFNIRSTKGGNSFMDAAYNRLSRTWLPPEEVERKVKQFLESKIWYEGNKKDGPVANAKKYLRILRSNPVGYATRQTEFKKEGDKLGKDYWGTQVELFARAWESWIFDTLDGKSPYLVNPWVADGAVTKDSGYRGTPFPTGEERKAFGDMYETLIENIEFSDEGVKLKEGAKFPSTGLDAVLKAADEIEPRLGQMMKEIEDGSVQQGEVPPSVSDSDGAGSPGFVPPDDARKDLEEEPDGGRGGSGDAVSGPVDPSTGESVNGRGAGQDRGNGDSVQPDDTVPSKSDVKDAPEPFTAKGENHVISLGDLSETRSQKQKAEDNIKIIKLVKKIESEGRAATPEEQITLAKFTGWGSIKNAFPDGKGDTKDGWDKIAEQVKEILTDEEYRQSRRTIQYAHYTSEIVTRSMWSAFKQFGLTQGNVFEPGMGIGNFVGTMPADMEMSFSGLEIDPMSARIAAILYPRSGVRNADFISAQYADGMFDAVIGNPPFSDTIVKSDKKYKGLSLHNYFFAKAIDMVADGGVLGFVTSRYTMDNLSADARKALSEKADLLGAIRLPDTAFKTNAHTEVVTDIIFLRKRRKGEESNGIKWTETKKIDVTDSDGKNHVFDVNEYFVNNPEMVLGDFSAEGSMYSANSLTVKPTESHNLQQQLEEAIGRLPEGVVTEIDKNSAAGLDMAPPEAKDGSYYIKDGTLMQVENGIGQPAPMRGKTPGGLTREDAEKVKKLIPVRDALRETMDAMVARDDKAMRKAQKELRKHYDAFVKKYGPITKSETKSRPPATSQLEEARDEIRNDYIAAGEEFNEGDIDLTHMIGKTNPATGKKYTPSQIALERSKRIAEIESKGGVVDHGDFDPSSVPDTVTVLYPNMDAFKADPEYYNFIVLENYDADTDTATTTEIFEKNIVRDTPKPEIKTSVDALNYSLAFKNKIDIDFMAKESGTNRDDMIRELEELDLIYGVPAMDGGTHYVYAEAYLSGLVRDKLAYAKRIAAQDPKYQRNVNALEAVQPRDIPASDINTQLGSPYFAPAVIQDFMEKELNIPAKVSYVPLINAWDVNAYDKTAAENTSVHGTSQRKADDIMASLLMRKEIKVTKKVNTEQGEKQVVDVEATQAAQDKAKAIQEKFDNWIWKSEHGEKVHRKYNAEYNNIVPRKFDGKHITVASSVQPRPHQKTAVWRILQTGNTYLAHAVGAGKTLEMAMAAMEMRRLGQWKKPLLVVPNHMLAQFAGEFRAAYPQAKIFVADERNFHTDRRQRFVANVAKGDWDAVVMTYSAFKKVPISKAFEAEMIQTEIDKYRLALEEANRTKSAGSRGTTAARIEKQIEKMENRLKGLKAQDVDQGFSFDQLGVDAIELDEGHYFRKLSFATMQGNMKGVNPIGSKAAWDLYVKAKYLDTIHPGRNLVIASGTPLTNTLAEVYTIQRYMNESALHARNIGTFDAWSSVYAASVTNAERQPSGAYKNVTRLAEFRNLNSLSQMVREFMDVVTSDELGALVDRPTMKSGTMIIKTTEPTREYLAFQKYLADRTAEVAKKRANEKGADNILSIINEGRHAAIDMRLIDPTLPESKSKLEDMIQNVFKIWKDTSGDEFTTFYKGKEKSTVKGGAQLIFSDLGVRSRTKDGVSFSAYDHIRRKLIRMGVPQEQIAFISDYDTTEEKRRLQAKVRNGEIRILIGSTAKMGTGMNVQNRLKAVHNLDAPWLPADLEQRTGRVVRQGNQYKEVEVYGYGTEGSYDSTMWGMLETKAKAIIQFLKGDGDLTTMRDIEETDHFRMAKAMTSGDSRVLKQAELESEVEKLARQSKNFINEQVQIKSNIARNKNRIEHNKQLIEDITAAEKKKVDFEGDKFVMTVSGQPFDERAAAAEALEKAVAGVVKDDTSTPADGVKVADYRGFEVRMFAGVGNAGTEYELFMTDPAFGDARSNKNEWKKGESFSGSGAISRLNNAINRMAKAKDDAAADITRSEREIKVLESQISGDFPKEEELLKKRRELAAIEKDLRENAPVEVLYDDYPLDYWRANKAAISNSTDASFYILGDEEFSYDNDNKPGTALPEKMQAAINNRLKALGWPAANFRIYDTADQLQPLAGMDSSVEGFYWRGIVHVALTAKDILSTINHEVLHGLKAAGAFTAAEWAALEGRAAEWRTKYKIDETYKSVMQEQGVTDPALLERKLNEEAIAHAFQDHDVQGIVRRLANKAVRFIKAIGEVLRGKGFNMTTAEEVFDAVGRGNIGARAFNKPADQAPSFSKRQAERQDNTETSAFKKWFGDSKIVDKDGEPLIVYHGSTGNIDRFKREKLGEKTGARSAAKGFFFAGKPRTADFYANLGKDRAYTEISNILGAEETWREAEKNFPYAKEELAKTLEKKKNMSGPNVMPVYLSIQNPYVHDMKGKMMRDQSFSSIIDEAKKKGHDGVIIKNTYDAGEANIVQKIISKPDDIYIAFEPNQIKSAFNPGTFDADSDFVMYSLSKVPKKALDDATATLANVRGLERNLMADLKRVSATVLHPQQIATLFKEFTPVYRAVIERFKQRETMIHQLGKHIDAYNGLKAESKKNVNAALEIGRLTGETFKVNDEGSIVVKNNGLENTVHSKDGDTITLTPAESAAYLGVRKAMDMAMDKFMDTILEEAGLLEKGIKTVQDVEKLRLEAVRDGNVNEVRRLKNVLERLNDVADAKKKGYIPFKRWGEIGVSVKNSDGELVHFERLELPQGWRKKGMIGDNKVVQDALERLGKEYNDADYDINFFEMSKFDEVQAHLDLRSLDILAASSEMKDADYQKLREMLEREMQKKGFRSHFFRSKDVPGYSDDFERAINDYVVTISSYIARRLHEKTIDGHVGAIAEAGKPKLYEYARDYQQYVNDPAEELAAIRMMGFFWYLAGNISSGLVNLSQPFLVTSPWLKGMFTHGGIGSALTKAYADAAKMVDKEMGMDVFNFEKAPADIRDALVKAYEEGDFMSMATNDAMAISSTSQSLRGFDKHRRMVADAIGLTFSVPEKINRIATFIAAYRLALDPKMQDKIRDFVRADELGKSMLAGKKSPKDFAFAFAELAVVSTQYRVGKLNRPKIGRGFGSLIFQFKSYVMQTFELMYKLSKVHGGENKKALAVIILSVVALAGLKGLPFEDDAQDLIEALFKFATKKDLDIDTDVREAIVKYTGSPVLAEALIKGVPAALMDVDLSGRLGFGNVAPDTGAGFLGVWWDMLYERPARAAGYASEGEYTRAITEISPAVVKNPMTAYLWAEDGVRTQKGKKVIDSADLDKSDIALKFLGFTSADVSRERERIYATDRASAAVDDLRSSYYNRLAKAVAERFARYEEGDKEGGEEMTAQIEAIKAEINRHNQTAPLHERIIINPYVIKKKVQEEVMGAKARKPRKQARLRAQELKAIYKVD